MLNANTKITQATVCSQNGAEKREKNGMNTFEQSEEEDEGKERERKQNSEPKKDRKAMKMGSKKLRTFLMVHSKRVNGKMCIYSTTHMHT